MIQKIQKMSLRNKENMEKVKKCLGILAGAFALCAVIMGACLNKNSEIMAFAAEPVVVVIDPGHGGENLGTNYLPIAEKYYTMQVALYMKEQLETYQNITVYLTHNSAETDMSFAQRAEYAKSVGADFMYSLHFNMSLEHSLYGSEVWIPSEGTLYTRGYSAANEFLTEFEKLGLFNRGIKTRLGSKGNDYYAIIRESAARNIPTIIVEHCHVDNVNDIANISSQEALKQLGIADAEAVARYFGLVSKDGSTDYRSYAPLAVPIPSGRVGNDTTAPDYLVANLVSYDKSGRFATVKLNSHDDESVLQYYTYSTDGGKTWAALKPWNKGSDTMTVTLSMDFGKKDSLVFKVYNLYDGTTVSNVLKLS
jgi:N-acetylmuramoyl-L-alanine amidase